MSSPRSRFPNLTVIVGHLGERIPSDLVRINDRTSSASVPLFILTVPN